MQAVRLHFWCTIQIMKHAKSADPRSVQRRYRVDVTAEDIGRAVKSNSAKCVVASAIAREIPESQGILVDIQTIRFSRLPERKRLVYLTPPEVAEYVVAFDAGDHIDPFSFTLSHPAFVQEMVVRRDANGNAHSDIAKVIHQVKTAEGAQEIEKKRPRKTPVPAGRTRYFGSRALRVNQA